MHSDFPLSPLSFSVLVLLISMIVLIRYFLVAGGFYLAVHVLGRKKFARLRIEDKPTPPAVIRGEIFYSVLSSLIFGVSGAALIMAWDRGKTLLYSDVSDYGVIYLGVSFFLFLFLHDTYFYWTHRWMHRPQVFKLIHEVHHRSRPPSPWAAFSFSPLEALIEAVILPALVFVIPLHIGVFVLLLTTMTVAGVINHLGYEIYPARLMRLPGFRYLIGATHHQLHHRDYRKHFGLYFTFWDRWMKTEVL